MLLPVLVAPPFFFGPVSMGRDHLHRSALRASCPSLHDQLFCAACLQALSTQEMLTFLLPRLTLTMAEAHAEPYRRSPRYQQVSWNEAALNAAHIMLCVGMG